MTACYFERASPLYPQSFRRFEVRLLIVPISVFSLMSVCLWGGGCAGFPGCPGCASPRPDRPGQSHGRPATGHQPVEAMAGHNTPQPETPDRELVILPAHSVTLPELLRHIKAGRIVLIIIPAPRTPPQPGLMHTAKPPRDRPSGHGAVSSATTRDRATSEARHARAHNPIFFGRARRIAPQATHGHAREARRDRAGFRFSWNIGHRPRFDRCAC